MSDIPLKRKLAFASADIFGGGSFNIINFLYPGFLALTVGINPFWISFVMLVARIWDSITDPLMGYISDHTKSKLGKRRIYLIISSPLILVGLYFLFFPYSFSSEFLRVIAVLVSYLIFTMIQTSIMIPYYSLSSEISSDYQIRASYNSYRLGFYFIIHYLCCRSRNHRGFLYRCRYRISSNEFDFWTTICFKCFNDRAVYKRRNQYADNINEIIV